MIPNTIFYAILISFIATTNSHSQTLKSVRIRVAEKVEYRDYVYSGRHWLKGIAISVENDSLVLASYVGVESVNISLSNITEMQIRSSDFEDWQAVNFSYADSEKMLSVLGYKPRTDSPTKKVEPFSDKTQVDENQDIIVAYIEDSGIEILKLHPELGATIRRARRQQIQIFTQIENYESAQYIRNVDGSYAVRIKTFDDEGIIHTATKPVSKSGIQLLQRRIKSTIEGPDNNSESLPPVITSQIPSLTSKVNSVEKKSTKKIFFYGTGSSHYIEKSSWSTQLRDDFDVKLAGWRHGAGNFGVIYDGIGLSVSFFSTRDNGFAFGIPSSFSYSVRTVDMTLHRVPHRIWQDTIFKHFKPYVGYGMAFIDETRKLGFERIDDNISGWHFIYGFRVDWVDEEGDRGWFFGLKNRSLGLVFKTPDNEKSTFNLGGFFLESGYIFRYK